MAAAAFGATACESFDYQKSGYHERGDLATPNFVIPRHVPTLAPAPSLEKQIHRRKMRSTAATTSASPAASAANAAAAAAAAAAASGASTADGAAAERNMKNAIGRTHNGAAAFDTRGDAANRAHLSEMIREYNTRKSGAPAFETSQKSNRAHYSLSEMIREHNTRLYGVPVFEAPQKMRREYHTRQSGGAAPALTINGRRRPSLSVNPHAAPPAASVSSSRPGSRLTRRGSADVALLCGSKGGSVEYGGDGYGGRYLPTSTRTTRSFSPWDSELDETASSKCEKTPEDCAAICLNMEDVEGMAAHKDLSRILISSIDIVSQEERKSPFPSFSSLSSASVSSLSLSSPSLSFPSLSSFSARVTT
ncbi:unnamed protein product [Closterium sp. Yama58-4]|nr:unnamed protein product [Closterium sp. Yama58-4]